MLALARDFPRLWCDPDTDDRERKRMLRRVIEDATLARSEQITVHLRFRGGADKTLVLPPPPASWASGTTSPAVVADIDRLLDRHTCPEIAAIPNERDLRSGKGQRFTARYIARIQRAYHLQPRYDRLRKAGMLTVEEMAAALEIHPRGGAV